MKYLGLNCIQQSVAIFVWAWFNGHMYLMNVNISPLCIFSFGLFKWIGMFEIWHLSLIMSRPSLSINSVQKGLKVSSHIKTVRDFACKWLNITKQPLYKSLFTHELNSWLIYVEFPGQKREIKNQFLLSFLNFIFISINLHIFIYFIHSNFLHFYCTYINILTYEFILLQEKKYSIFFYTFFISLKPSERKVSS